MWAFLAVLSLAFATGASAAAYHVPRDGGKCNQDNCLRALQNKQHEAGVNSFCASFLSTTAPATATGAIPTYLANCGTTSQASRLSSACSCFLSSTATTTATTVGSATACLGSVTTVTLPGTTSTCGATTVTETATGPTVTAPGSTITETAPGTTRTETVPGPVVTETAPASTVTAPGTTVTTAGPTTTVTAPAPARTCAQAFADPGFESLQPYLYPWAFASTAGWGVRQSWTGDWLASWPWIARGPHSGSVAMQIVIGSSGGPGDFGRLWQPFAPCFLSTAYRPRLWYATNAASAEGTVTFRVSIYTTPVGAPTALARVAYTSTQTVSCLTQGSWALVEFGPWTSEEQTTAVLQIDVSTTRRSYTIWMDDITLSA